MGSSGAGGKDSAGVAVAPGGTSYAPLIRPAKEAVHISCIIHLILVIHLDHLAADRKNLRRPLNGLNHFTDKNGSPALYHCLTEAHRASLPP